MELALEVLLPPFVACLVLTGVHTYLGLHVVSRGVIFVDLALAQIAALGATFAFLLGYDPHGGEGYLYSLIFTFIGAAVFSISRLKDERVPQEAIIGITFAVASAATILIADRAPQGSEFVEAMLTGALLWVPWSTILKTAAIYVAIGVFHWIFRRRFLAISLDHAGATAQGLSVRWWDFLFYTSFGFVITSSVAMAGVLLVFSFLIIPSVIAMLFAHSIRMRLILGWITGTVVSMVGLSLSYAYDFPSGPAVVCTFGLALLLAGLVRYLIVAERPLRAALNVAAVAVLVAGGLRLAFWTAAVTPRAEGVEAAAEETTSVVTDPATTAMAALGALESSPDEPPPEALAALLTVGEDLHRLMGTGEVEISEAAVTALATAAESRAANELLEEIAYHAADPWARLRAGEALVARRDVLGIEALIELLEAELPPFLQLQAAEALRQGTGQEFAFDPLGEPLAKRQALAAWRDWWEANRGAPFPD